MQFGVLTVGDDCTTKEAEGAGFTDPLSTAISTYFTGSKIISKSIPSECNEIVSQLKSWCNSGCDVIFTQGCTRFTIQDITPELPKLVKEETVRLVNAIISEIPQMTMLTRPVCQIIQKTLVIHLPGNAECAIDCFGFIKDTLESAVALIKDTNNINSILQNKSDQSKDSIQKSRQSEIQISSPSKVKLKSYGYNRKQIYVEVKKAWNLIIKEIYPSYETEVIPYEESLNKVLAEDIYAPEDVPPFPVSLTDGYAIKSGACSQHKLIVQQTLAAGGKEELKPGEAFLVCTGTPIPSGADTVVDEEKISSIKKCLDGSTTITISYSSAGDNIRKTGSVYKANSLVLEKFDLITSEQLRILEVIKKSEVKVFKHPSIAVISIRSEVNDLQKNLKPEQKPHCKKTILMNFFKKYGYNLGDCGMIKPDPNMIKSAFEQAFSNHDVVITCGDAFMADFNVLKEVLIEDFSAFIHFDKVNVEPGNSTLFATLKYKGHVKIFFGLQGNANSCIVASIVFVIPTLRFMERSKNYKFPVRSHQVKVLTQAHEEYKMFNCSIKNGSLQFCQVDQVNCYVNNMVHGNCLALIPRVNPSGYCTCDIIFFDCF